MLIVDNKLKNILPEIVKPYDEDLVSVASLDVRLDGFIKIIENAEINYPKGSIEWKTSNFDFSFLLEPGQCCLASTVECFNIPNWIYADVKGKSTIARTFLSIEMAGFIDPGFQGQITLEIKNNGKIPYFLYKNQLIAQVRFWECQTPDIAYGKNNSYQGQLGPTEPNMKKIYRYCKSTEKKW
jgi:dCTP deaminase